MNKQSSPGIPASFLDRLIENVDPHRISPSPQLLQAQRLAGRWLALRRMQQKLTPAQIAMRANISVDVVQCLEAGIATPGQLSFPAQMRVCHALAPRASSASQREWLAQVVALALGDASFMEGPTIDKILTDLERAEPARPADALLVLEITLPYKTPHPAVGAVGLLYTEPVAHQILQALAVSPEHTLDSLWQQLDPKQERFTLATRIGIVLQTLSDKGLVREARQAPDPALDNDIVHFYCITPEGRQALQQLANELVSTARPLPGSDAILGL